MNPARFNMIVYGDAIFDLEFQYTDILGNAIDIFEYNIQMVAVSNSVRVMNCSTDNNQIIIVDSEAGRFKFNVSSAITKKYTFTEAVYKLYINAPDQDKSVLAEGVVSYEKGFLD